MNIIDTDWGKIIELSRNKKRSVAMICLDPLEATTHEAHSFAETFEHVSGHGKIYTENSIRNLRIAGQQTKVERGVCYRLVNPSRELWIFYAICRPPFNPNVFPPEAS